jgi:hypothetical protein
MQHHLMHRHLMFHHLMFHQRFPQNLSGDRIIRIDGREIANYHDIQEMVALSQGIGVYSLKGMDGGGERADLARGRCLAALREAGVSAIPRGSGPGLGA